MGACPFFNRVRGKTAKEAFDKARAEAQFEHGHSYSGTIGEKSTFTMITPPANIGPADYANKLIQDGDRRIDDKWGPAGCIKVADEEFIFFGWASE